MESIMRDWVVAKAARMFLVWVVTGVIAALLCALSLSAHQPPPDQSAPAPNPSARPDQQPQARTPTGTGAAQEGFVPVEQLPNPQETIPAPRLVAIAYACVWIVLVGYLYSIWRRLGTVERELQTVSRRLPTESRRS
jgi:CcmD family protein